MHLLIFVYFCIGNLSVISICVFFKSAYLVAEVILKTNIIYGLKHIYQKLTLINKLCIKTATLAGFCPV